MRRYSKKRHCAHAGNPPKVLVSTSRSIIPSAPNKRTSTPSPSAPTVTSLWFNRYKSFVMPPETLLRDHFEAEGSPLLPS